MSDLANEDTENTTEATGTSGTDKINKKGKAKPSPVTSILSIVWNTVMIVCTAVLCFYFFVLKDDSVFPYIVLGVIGLCMPPIVDMFRAMARNKQLVIENEEKVRKAQLERIAQVRRREMERLELQRIMAENEAAEQAAIKNIDIAAIKAGNPK